MIMLRLEFLEINEQSITTDLVKAHFRTASVFKKYGIEYCCGLPHSLKDVCMTKGLDCNLVLREVREAATIITLPASLRFEEWKTDFLVDYLINIHHHYLRESLPYLKEHVNSFVAGHKKKYPQLEDLQRELNLLDRLIIPHLDQEEEIIFPYIRQIAHAYESKEPYARLLVRTLRKPVEEMMQHEDHILDRCLNRIRSLTNNYTAPDAACMGHRLTFSLLRELDNDLVQHIYLENSVLFPRTVAMEKELLERS